MYDRPFWLDECALALNIVHVKNYFLSLGWDQFAPALFLYLSKLMYNIFPDKELALRFLPQLFSILSIFVFYKFSKIYLKKNITILLALALFCFIYPLIYYSQEFKPYAIDVFFFLIILYSYYYLEKIETKKEMIILSIFYSLAFYFSLASFFAEFTVFLTLLIFNKKQFFKIIYIIIPIVLSAICFYVFVRCTITRGYFQNFWDNKFISNNFVQNINIIKANSWYIFQSFFPIFIFFISLFLILRKDIKNKDACLYFIPVLLACILSYLKLYPLYSRLFLYLVPCIIIFLVKWIDYVEIKNKITYIAILLIFSFVMFFPVLKNDYRKIFKKELNIEDIKPLLEYANKISKPDEIFIISGRSNWLYEYYKQEVPIKNIVAVIPTIKDKEKFFNYIESFPKGKTYFLFYVHETSISTKYKNFKEQYDWAKDKENFHCKRDKYSSAVFRYKL